MFKTHVSVCTLVVEGQVSPFTSKAVKLFMYAAMLHIPLPLRPWALQNDLGWNILEVEKKEVVTRKQ